MPSKATLNHRQVSPCLCSKLPKSRVRKLRYLKCQVVMTRCDLLNQENDSFPSHLQLSLIPHCTLQKGGLSVSQACLGIRVGTEQRAPQSTRLSELPWFPTCHLPVLSGPMHCPQPGPSMVSPLPNPDLLWRPKRTKTHEILSNKQVLHSPSRRAFSPRRSRWVGKSSLRFSEAEY